MQRTESICSEGVKNKARKLKCSESLVFVCIQVSFQDQVHKSNLFVSSTGLN